MQVPLIFYYLFALEPIYLNIKGIDLLLIIIERLEYTPPLFWTRPVKPRLITYQLLFDATVFGCEGGGGSGRCVEMPEKSTSGLR